MSYSVINPEMRYYPTFPYKRNIIGKMYITSEVIFEGGAPHHFAWGGARAPLAPPLEPCLQTCVHVQF